MDFLIFDAETFWDGAGKQPYTLSKMTTEEYVRDPRFEIILVGVKKNDDPPLWFSGTHDETREFLIKQGIEDCAVVMHNAMFDVAILSWVLNLKPKFIVDTLSMARPIHGAVRSLSLAKLSEHYGIGTKGDDTRWAQGLHRRDFTPEQLETYAGYCATRPDSDVNLTYRLFKILAPLTSKRELALIDATIRLFAFPTLVLDRPMLEKHLSSVRAEKDRLLATLGGSPEEAKKNLMSNDRFATLLREHGVEPPTKISPTTGKETFAFAKTDQGMTDLLEHENPEVQTLVAARLGVKSTIEETRTERLIGIATRGAFPVPLSYCGAHTTWRHSGTDKINPQNFSRGGAIRRAIMAPAGCAIVVGDSAGIELRVNHTLAGQEDAISAFRDGRDLYCEFASRLYGRPIGKDDKAERFLGKLAMLSLGYGAGAVKFREICRQKGVDITETRSQEIVTLWRDVYAKIPRLWRRHEIALTAMSNGSLFTVDDADLVTTWTEGTTSGFAYISGHRIRYHDLRRDADGWSYHTNRGRKKLWGGACTENSCQHLARNIIAEQWLQFQFWCQKFYPQWKVVLQVHDELVAVGPEDEAPEVAKHLERILSTPPSWWPDLPLAAETGYAQRYGEAKS